ncbi:hypothetical protein V6N11_071718 [Hibiscus sabdariffa]|uniref:Uncharacterized protein n=1 Tax=Hibiscus sabdariffa TaxID=183260 RepID=A0ABR2U1Q3_9ROSI
MPREAPVAGTTLLPPKYAPLSHFNTHGFTTSSFDSCMNMTIALHLEITLATSQTFSDLPNPLTFHDNRENFIVERLVSTNLEKRNSLPLWCPLQGFSSPSSSISMSTTSSFVALNSILTTSPTWTVAIALFLSSSQFLWRNEFDVPMIVEFKPFPSVFLLILFRPFFHLPFALALLLIVLFSLSSSPSTRLPNSRNGDSQVINIWALSKL